MNENKLCKEKIEAKRKELDNVSSKYSKLSRELEVIKEELELLEKEEEERVNYKVWKAMEGKYYHVWLFTISEEDKFKRCKYYHIIQVEKDLLKYEYINYEENCMFITISTSNTLYQRSYRAWTEISKREYEKIISSTKGLERLPE